MSTPKTDREYAIDEIGEGLVRQNEYLDSQTPDMLAATDAAIQDARESQPGYSPELSVIEQYIVEQSIIALGGR
jgi:hypothetical protein